MKKVIIIGCPGSGKSTFAKALHQATGLLLFHLDILYWNVDKTNVSKSVFLERLYDILQQDQWIIDGNYSSTMELRMQACDTVIFLDYPPALCLDGIRQRRGKPRSDMPWIETEEDAAFTQFVKDFHAQSRPQILQLLSQYSHKSIYTFTSRTEAEAFLTQLQV